MTAGIKVQAGGKPRATVEVSRYEDILHVLRSRDFGPMSSESGYNHEFQMMFTGGALIDLNGEDHFERRRLISALFRRATLGEYETEYLKPAVLEALSRVGSSTDEMDLLPFIWHIMMRLMVRLVGVDGLETREAEDRYTTYFRDFDRGARSKHNYNPGPVAERGRVARDKMNDEFIQPSMTRREALLADVAAGRLPESALPRDVLTLLLQHEDYYREHCGDKARETMHMETNAFMMASIGSTANALCGAVYEIDRWVRTHPEDEVKLDDPGFLRRSFMEAARLHQTNYMWREAYVDATLPSGRRIEAGTVMILDRVEAGVELASRLTAPGEGKAFDPYRRIEGAAPYVLGFGQGPHMCIGRQMVLGDEYHDADDESAPNPKKPRLGLAVTFLEALYSAGVRIAPGATPSVADDTGRETWTEFPVVFTKL
jgi:cytochrome P450